MENVITRGDHVFSVGQLNCIVAYDAGDGFVWTRSWFTAASANASASSAACAAASASRGGGGRGKSFAAVSKRGGILLLQRLVLKHMPRNWPVVIVLER